MTGVFNEVWHGCKPCTPFVASPDVRTPPVPCVRALRELGAGEAPPCFSFGVPCGTAHSSAVSKAFLGKAAVRRSYLQEFPLNRLDVPMVPQDHSSQHCVATRSRTTLDRVASVRAHGFRPCLAESTTGPIRPTLPLSRARFGKELSFRR